MTIVVAGGGLVGASIAYHLSLRGVKPIVVEREEVAAAASGKAGGFLARGWGSGPTVALHEVSFDMHADLAKELGITSYRRLPTLSVKGGVRSRGTPKASWLDGAAHATVMDPDTAQVTPKELTTRLMEEAVKRGAELRIGTVTGVRLEEAAEATGASSSSSDSSSKRVAAVVVGEEEIPCDSVVVAMGPWSTVASDWFGINVPMEGIKSTSIVFEGDNAAAVAEPYALFCAEDRRGCHLEVYPRPNGEIYLCGLGGSDHVSAKRLKPGGDCESPALIQPDPSRVDAAWGSFREISSLGQPRPGLTQACMRPCPPDSLPIMGAVPGVAGGYIAAGHNCWGILWGPVTGLAMTELIVDGQAKCVDLKPFSPARFMAKAGRRGRKKVEEGVGEQW